MHSTTLDVIDPQRSDWPALDTVPLAQGDRSAVSGLPALRSPGVA